MLVIWYYSDSTRFWEPGMSDLILFTCKVVYFSCFVFQQKCFTSVLKSSEVESCDSFPLSRRREFTRSWALGPSPPIWLLMVKTTSIIWSNILSVFMYVIIFTCDVGDLDEEIVSSLTIWTISSLKNTFQFSCAVANLGWVSSGRIKGDSPWWSAVRFFMPARSCLLTMIVRRHQVWYTTIFNMKKCVAF